MFRICLKFAIVAISLMSDTANGVCAPCPAPTPEPQDSRSANELLRDFIQTTDRTIKQLSDQYNKALSDKYKCMNEKRTLTGELYRATSTTTTKSPAELRAIQVAKEAKAAKEAMDEAAIIAKYGTPPTKKHDYNYMPLVHHDCRCSGSVRHITPVERTRQLLIDTVNGNRTEWTPGNYGF